MENMPDVQQSVPRVKVKLNRVGVSHLTLPISIQSETGKIQTSVAKVSCYVDLASDKKGINMSRLPIGLHKYLNQSLNGTIIKDIAENIRQVSKAEICQVIYEFHYFIEKLAPASKEPGLIDHKIIFDGTKTESSYIWKFSVETVGTSLCPCSKEISTAGAHNQKCYITTDIWPNDGKWIWIEDIVKICEQSCSCEIYSILKRIDEKIVTERAYDNPMFVEDVARSVYEKLAAIDDIDYFKIKVASDESIHMHRAEAIIKG
jgi:GTP cyclohydrolase I